VRSTVPLVQVERPVDRVSDGVPTVMGGVLLGLWGCGGRAPVSERARVGQNVGSGNRLICSPTLKDVVETEDAGGKVEIVNDVAPSPAVAKVYTGIQAQDAAWTSSACLREPLAA
jgi:hypothetical protein